MFNFSLPYFFAFALFISIAHAQSTTPVKENEPVQSDSVKVRKHPPRVAMLFSMFLPGLGQAYNKKFWKIPLVYASMGTTLYFFNFNNKLYRDYKQAYINKTDTATSTIDLYPEYSGTQLKELESYHRKYRDLNVILTALFYTINVVDAYVDAHLMNFDVSDDLSLQVAPSLHFHAVRQKPAAGLTLTFKF